MSTPSIFCERRGHGERGGDSERERGDYNNYYYLYYFFYYYYF